MKIKLGNIQEKHIRLPANYGKLSPMEKADIRDRYIFLQQEKCWYCKRTLTKGPSERVRKLPLGQVKFPKTFFHHRIHLHHNHTTGLTIGAVHAKCNAVLWIYHGE